MFRTTLFIGTTLLLLSGFTFFTFNGPEEPVLDPTSIFYPVDGDLDWLKVKDGYQLTAQDIVERYRADLGLGLGDELVLYRKDQDDIGFTHYRYQQYYKGIKVQGSQLLVHEKDGKVQTVNGSLVRGLRAETIPALSPDEAIELAIAHLPAHQYMWEDATMEALLKRIKNDETASYYPEAELVWVDPAFKQERTAYRLAFSTTVYAKRPEAQKWLFVDAKTGEVFHEIEMLHTQQVQNTPGVAETKYHGTRDIITDSVGVDSFRLVETTRGRGIYTYNLNSATDSINAVNFWDTDNYWNNVNNNEDEVATDAHWGAEMTFDYFHQHHNHVGVDGDSMELISMVHYGANVTNAFWNGSFASFGDGGNSSSPLTSLDVVGHEFTHGVTRSSANLVYQDESGALNESFSDIFGVALEFWADPATSDWLMGEDFLSNDPFRNMSDPNAEGHPDTYFGTSWTTGNGDNGGVHTNSGVQNFWFFLLTEGKVDTNDIGNPYEVIGLGLDTASQIAFRNLKYYLTESSEYADARIGAIQAATDIYGDCSFAMRQTVAAWYAVGVGQRQAVRDIDLIGIEDVEPFACGVGGDEEVNVRFIFRDCDTILQPGTKIPLFYQLEGSAAKWDTAELVNTLTFGDTINFTFTETMTELSQPGIYQLTVGAEFPNDNTPENNQQVLELERIIDQNFDLGTAGLPDPKSGCFLTDQPVTIEIGFYGCELIEQGFPLEASFKLNDGTTVTEALTVPFDLNRGETFLHTFAGEVDLSEIRLHEITAWVSSAPDTLTVNDQLPVQFIANPKLITLEDFISFEAGQTSMDSFYYQSSRESSVLLSEEAAREGAFGVLVKGGDVEKEFFNNQLEIPDPSNVWDLNPQFRSKVCFCTNLVGLMDAEFKFRLRQTYSPMYQNDFGLEGNAMSAARVMIENTQESIDFFPLGNTGSPYFLRTIDLENYLGSTVEICIETSTLLAKELDPYGIGDNVHIDNVTIVGTPSSVFDPLLPEDAVTVYPNPTSGHFTLKILNDTAIDGLIQISNTLGQVVQQQPLSIMAGEHNLDLRMEQPSPGMYFIQLIADGKKVVKELVVF